MGSASFGMAAVIAASAARRGNASRLASTIREYPTPVDIAVVHDPASAGGLAGTCPLVLAGHLHARRTATLSNGGKQTFLMVQGSTGGAGLRGLEHEEPTPLELSVLYFDPKGTLQAYDDMSNMRADNQVLVRAVPTSQKSDKNARPDRLRIYRDASGESL